MVCKLCGCGNVVVLMPCRHRSICGHCFVQTVETIRHNMNHCSGCAFNEFKCNKCNSPIKTVHFGGGTSMPVEQPHNH